MARLVPARVGDLPDRDSPLYPWHRKPADHNPAGLFVDGPQPAQPSIVRLMGTTAEPVNVPSPAQIKHAAAMTARLKERRRREFEAMRAAVAARVA